MKLEKYRVIIEADEMAVEELEDIECGFLGDVEVEAQNFEESVKITIDKHFGDYLDSFKGYFLHATSVKLSDFTKKDFSVEVGEDGSIEKIEDDDEDWGDELEREEDYE